MKKFLSFFAVLVLFTACDPPQNCYSWWIKNSTDETLTLNFYDCTLYEPSYRTGLLSPGDSVVLYRICFGEKNHMQFDSYFEKSASLGGVNVHWQILSEDRNTVLKTWRYSDYSLPDQRFFEKSSWRHYVNAGHGRISYEYLWTFEIQPEDITQD